MKRIVLVAVGLLAMVGGCASTPKTLPQLEQARTAVQQLASDPLASQSASLELQSARTALDRADQAWKQKQPLPEVVHLSYLAERRADLGTVRLAEVRARQQISRGEADRETVLLQAREREAQRATARANANALDAAAAQRAALIANQQVVAQSGALEEARRKLADLRATQTERGMVLTLGDVLFDTAEADLKTGAASTLDRLAQFLRENSDTRVLIEGYTDSRGSAEYNQVLSRRRAAAVSEALEARGTATDRVNVVGRGEMFPVASNETSAGRQRNRRVEIVFSDASGKFADNVTRR
jgi:outer membrane protein OmpA-like peptidoglycan-associated protein